MSLTFFLIAIAVWWLFWPRKISITRVVDGDSLEAIYRNERVRIRIRGYDAPEYRQAGGKAARLALGELVQEHSIRMSPPSKDRYGRCLATCYAGWWPISWRMIIKGYGWHDGIFGLILSLLPRIGRRGIWKQKGPIHPRLWRKYQSHH